MLAQPLFADIYGSFKNARNLELPQGMFGYLPLSGGSRVHPRYSQSRN